MAAATTAPATNERRRLYIAKPHSRSVHGWANGRVHGEPEMDISSARRYGPLSKLVDEADSKSVAADPASRFESGEGQVLGRMRVLLVEDDPGVLEGLAELASEFGEVRQASSVAEAMEALAQEAFALVLTDLHIDGSEAGGRRVAAHARERRAKVVIISGSTRSEIEQALEGWKPDAVIEKPFQIEDVLKIFEAEKARSG
jgi:CheY-like chemotaxis protein